MKAVSFFVILIFLSSCAVVPKTADDADNSRCNLATKKMSLDVVGAKGGCPSGGGGAGVIVCLTAAGVFAITGIISSSLVIAGNTIHWIEKQGKCEDSFMNTYILKHNQELLDNKGILVKPEDSISPQVVK